MTPAPQEPNTVGQTIAFCRLSSRPMLSYHRHLPHWIPDEAVVFVTWRLAGSMPVPTPEILKADKFLEEDRLRDRIPFGPVWLQDHRIAAMIVEALHYGEAVRKFYKLHAYVIMPNHVHVVLEPRTPLPKIMRWLKGRTARGANRILERTGMPFWQDESYDHWIRSSRELKQVIRYVERNPVTAGLVQLPQVN